MKTLVSILAVAASLALAAPAAAQDEAAMADDWDVVRDPAAMVVTAVLAFDAGPGVVVTCRGERLEAAISGLPPLTEGTGRRMTLNVEGGEPRAEAWFNTTGGVAAFSPTPATFARSLRGGGVLTVRTAGSDGRARRISLPLPGGHTGIDQALTACGVPLEDAWDALPVWDPQENDDEIPLYAVEPVAGFPMLALERGVRQGYAVLGCVVADGGALADCRVTAETPPDVGFGPAALAAVGPARVTMPSDPSRAVGHRFTATIPFQAR